MCIRAVVGHGIKVSRTYYVSLTEIISHVPAEHQLYELQMSLFFRFTWQCALFYPIDGNEAWCSNSIPTWSAILLEILPSCTIFVASCDVVLSFSSSSSSSSPVFLFWFLFFFFVLHCREMHVRQPRFVIGDSFVSAIYTHGIVIYNRSRGIWWLIVPDSRLFAEAAFL